MSYLTTIRDALVTSINSMKTCNGYCYTYSSQQEDFNKTTFPLINVYLLPSEDSYDTNVVCLNESRKISHWQLQCYNKAISETSNNVYNINYVLCNMQQDLKRMIGNNYTLNGICEGIVYKKSYLLPIGLQNDLMLPKKLIVELDISYSEER